MKDFYVQIQNSFRLNKGSKQYMRILFELGEYGAIAITKDVDGKMSTRSYLPEQLREKPKILAVYDLLREEHAVRFLFSETEPDKFLRGCFSKAELLDFNTMLYRMHRAATAHFRKVRCDSKTFDDTYQEILILKGAFRKVLEAGSFAPESNRKTTINEILNGEFSKEPQEKADSPEQAEDISKYLLFCKDAGSFENLTTGMLYPIISEDKESGYYKIKDDFGVEHEFKKDRFEKIQMEPES